MFTLKFCRFNEGFDSTLSISTPVYEVYKKPSSITLISIYKSPVLTDGVEYRIGGDDGYDVCFVENLSGKTIDTIRMGGGMMETCLHKT